VLIVGVNSDESVRRLKGSSRPVRSEAERAFVLAAVECVDLVVVFPEDTPLELVKILKPDVIVKGGDYTENTIVGASEVKSWGGRVVVVPLTPGQSTRPPSCDRSPSSAASHPTPRARASSSSARRESCVQRRSRKEYLAGSGEVERVG